MTKINEWLTNIKKAVERNALSTKSVTLKATIVTEILAIGLGTEFLHQGRKEKRNMKNWKEGILVFVTNLKIMARIDQTVI